MISDHVGCDLDRAFALLDAADRSEEPEATAHRTRALELVGGEPFEGSTWDWASHVAAAAVARLQDAALYAAREHRRNERWTAAADALARGHKLLPGNGDLYLEEAHLEMDRGHPERIGGIWTRYLTELRNTGDDLIGIAPAPAPHVEIGFQDLDLRTSATA